MYSYHVLYLHVLCLHNVTQFKRGDNISTNLLKFLNLKAKQDPRLELL